MSIKDELNDIKGVINNLLVQQSLSMAKNSLLESLLFKIIADKCPEEEKQFYTQFVDHFASLSDSHLKELEEGLFDVGDPAFSFRQQFQNLMNVNYMKNDDRYLKNDQESASDSNS